MKHKDYLKKLHREKVFYRQQLLWALEDHEPKDLLDIIEDYSESGYNSILINSRIILRWWMSSKDSESLELTFHQVRELYYKRNII